MRVWLWWSSGKDSAWALQALRSDPDLVVEALVTTVTPSFGRVSIHSTRIEILEAQARSVGLPLHRVELPFPCSNDEYEAATREMLAGAVRSGVHGLASGDLFLEDVRAYREALLEPFGLVGHFPLWGMDTTELAHRIIDASVEAYITCLDPSRLDPDLAGARYDGEFLAALPEDVDPCGEGGEFHTCVVAGPMMETRVPVVAGDVVERDGFVYADLLPDSATPADA